MGLINSSYKSSKDFYIIATT